MSSAKWRPFYLGLNVLICNTSVDIKVGIESKGDLIMLYCYMDPRKDEILIEIKQFSFKKMRLKTSSAKWPLFCLGVNVLSFLRVASIARSEAPPTARVFKSFLVQSASAS